MWWQKKTALPCGVCKGKGFYICKLCNGNATIQWSPLYDPVAINPCLCPTCDGNRLVTICILEFGLVLVENLLEVKLAYISKYIFAYYLFNWPKEKYDIFEHSKVLMKQNDVRSNHITIY